MKMEKESDLNLQFIKAFCNISVSKICKDLGISRSSISSGKAKNNDIRKVRVILEEELDKLYDI